MFEFGEFSQKQIDSLKLANKRINMWTGSVRSGKTVVSLLRWLAFVKEDKSRGNFVMIGKTERTLKRNVIDLLMEMVSPNEVRYQMQMGELTLFGKTIYLVGANDEGAERKIRGLTLYGAYCDEVSLYPESFFKMLLSRLSVRGAKLFATTNPDHPYHWLKTDYIDREHELNMRVFNFIIDDNLTLDKQYVDDIKKEYTGVWYDRFILGKWVQAEGIIYDTYNPLKHDYENKTMEFDNYIVGIDYGTKNPCVFNLYGYNDPVSGDTRSNSIPEIYHIREYYHDGRKGVTKTNTQYKNDFINFLNGIHPIAVYVDPSATSFILELRDAGYNVIEGDNNVVEGIRFVSNLFRNDTLFICKDNKYTKSELVSYVWDAKKQEKGEDKPIKQNDHSMDATRYALYTHFVSAFLRPTISSGDDLTEMPDIDELLNNPDIWEEIELDGDEFIN